ncbi:MAG TPA: hypothetical protein VJ892_00910 [Candidatus Absconditabacterales bacterium]|nr:hypothetical protein [Candidatus Absconditabacterales bacterium]
MPLMIPQGIECVPTYVVAGVISVASGIIIHLVKRIKEKEKYSKDIVSGYLDDLREQRANIQSISDKKTTLVLQNLENQITKLEVIFKNLNIK